MAVAGRNKGDCVISGDYRPGVEGFCMIIDQALLDKLTAEAKASARLRMNFDLQTQRLMGARGC